MYNRFIAERFSILLNAKSNVSYWLALLLGIQILFQAIFLLFSGNAIQNADNTLEVILVNVMRPMAIGALATFGALLALKRDYSSTNPTKMLLIAAYLELFWVFWPVISTNLELLNLNFDKALKLVLTSFFTDFLEAIPKRYIQVIFTIIFFIAAYYSKMNEILIRQNETNVSEEPTEKSEDSKASE